MDCIGVTHDKGPIRSHIITLQTSLPCKQHATLTDQFQNYNFWNEFPVKADGDSE